MEMANDPRYFQDNVLLKRMDAYHVIGVTAVLLGNLSCMQMLKMESDDFHGIKGNIRYAAFCVFAATFVLNLVTVIIIVQQMFQVTRLATAGSTGFEIAKSYYMNPNIVALRHTAVMTFFCCIPIFMIGVGLSLYVNLGGRFNLMWSLPLSIMLWLAAILINRLYEMHRGIFETGYRLSVTTHEPLLSQMQDNNTMMTRRLFDDNTRAPFVD